MIFFPSRKLPKARIPSLLPSTLQLTLCCDTWRMYLIHCDTI